MISETLKQLMPPPAAPAESRSERGWEFVEAELGIELPSDYKEYISIYGTGSVDNFLWVLNPFSENKYLNLIDESKATLQAFQQLQRDFGETIPYTLYPEPLGLFPWAVTDNGDHLFWLRKGSPSEWAIVVADSRAPEWEEFKVSMTEFLAGILTKRIRVDIFPDDFPSDSPKFIPFYSLTDFQQRTGRGV